MSDIRLPIRQLVEFLLRSGSIDNRFAGFDRALEGARIHRRLQKAAGEGYAAEVPLCADYTVAGIRFTLEGRADGIFTNETGVVTIDEIKTTAVPEEEICEDMNPCHWAQGMVYGAIYSAQENLPAVDVRLTYYLRPDPPLCTALFPAGAGAIPAQTPAPVSALGTASACMAGNPQRQPDRHAVPV